jgi:glutamyl-tRNA synthetase
MGVRFAPSPTGVFHVGNLRTAWISWKWARALGLPWVVRFEDIDAPRVVHGAREAQLGDLAALGLRPDESGLQSERLGRHSAAFALAQNTGQVYPCYCSRKDVRMALDASASAPHRPDAQYSGRCRALNAAPAHELPSLAWRFRNEAVSGCDDFIVGRTDRDGKSFVPAYQWACAIDDLDGNYALLVRAHDLAPAAQLQRAIQSWLGRAEGRAHLPAAIFHTALVTANDGARLEKRTRGVTLAELPSGVGVQELLRRFEASFDVDRFLPRYQPGALFGESERITLAELGL